MLVKGSASREASVSEMCPRRAVNLSADPVSLPGSSHHGFKPANFLRVDKTHLTSEGDKQGQAGQKPGLACVPPPRQQLALFNLILDYFFNRFSAFEEM